MEQNPWAGTRRQPMADGWASFCTLADPVGTWERIISARVSVEEPILGIITVIVAPFVYLADVGTPESIGAELEAIRTTAASIRRLGLTRPGFRPSTFEHDGGIETAKYLDAFAEKFQYMQHAAAMAEELLRRNGWKYDAKTGRVREVAPRKGGDFLATLIRRLGVEYGGTPSGRVAIKAALQPVFPDLDAGPRGNIKTALDNLRRAAKP